MAALRATALLCLSLFLVGAHAESPAIEWRLKNPFPLLAQEDYNRMLLKFRSIPSDKRVHSGMHGLYLSLVKREEIASRDGNAREFLLADPTATAYHAESSSYAEGYVLPKGSRVPVLVRTANGGSKQCSWRIGLGKLVHGRCDQWTEMEAPIEEPFSLDVQFENGSKAQEPAYIEDYVVGALGDSFASGEGNPDIPAAYRSLGTPLHSNWLFEDFARFKGSAQWWDLSCHRSLVSWPVMATLKLALQDTKQQRRYTILNFSCSGAELWDGIFFAQLEPPGLGAINFKRDGFVDWHEAASVPFAVAGKSQLNALRGELCRGDTIRESVRRIGSKHAAYVSLVACDKPKRKLDALMISIGGNDVNFPGVVKSVVLPHTGVGSSIDKAVRTLVLKVFRGVLGVVSFEDGERAARKLKNEYAELIRSVARAADIDSKDLLLVTYPNVVGARGSVCGTPQNNTVDGRRVRDSNLVFGWVVHHGTLGLAPKGWITGINKSEVEGFFKFYDAISAMQHGAGEFVQTVSFLKSDGKGAFEGRRLCDPQRWPPGAREYLEMEPTDILDGEPDYPNIPRYFCYGTDCKNLPIEEWRMHRGDRRVVSSMNDSMLAMRRWSRSDGSVKNSLMFEAMAGAMHPVPEAHAEAADNVADELCRILRRRGRAPLCQGMK